MERYEAIMTELKQLGALFDEEYAKGNVYACVSIQDDISELIHEASSLCTQIQFESSLTLGH